VGLPVIMRVHVKRQIHQQQSHSAQYTPEARPIIVATARRSALV
jgi:hypothetical protein